MKMKGMCAGSKCVSVILGTWERKYLGSDDLVRRVDWQGETLI